MKSILLGHDTESGKPVYIPVDAFARHLHLPGTTGAGKTTALLTMMYQLLADPHNRACHFITDFLGGMTYELLLWMSSKYCPEFVRERLVLIQPARSGCVLPMNPLLYENEDDGFFKVNRAMDLLLRCWQAQSLGEQPRLARWLFNSLWACAQLGLTIADTVHLLLPHSDFHKPMLRIIPERLQFEWRDILEESGGNRRTEILDSTRNRMKPFYESGILRSMFGSVHNRLDMLQFMREGKIVVLDLSPHGRLAPQEANAIAGLALNELLATARSLPRHIRYPVYCWLDECQRAVSPDLEFAIPEVRQLGIRLLLAHQTMAQLKRGDDLDLTSHIFLPNTRLVFAEQGDDAEILSQEFASITYDAKRIKEEIHTLRQLQTGHRIAELSSWGSSHTDGRDWKKTYAHNWSGNKGTTRQDGSDIVTRNEGGGSGGSSADAEGHTSSDAFTRTTHEQLVAELETIRELSSRTYYTFEEQRNEWAKRIRILRTGECLLKIWNDPRIYNVKVRESRPGPLAFDPAVLAKKFPQVLEAQQALIERNFAREWFTTPEAVAHETQERLQRILKPPIVIHSQPSPPPETTGFGV